MEKIPYLIVVGEKEEKTKTISVESRDHGKLATMSLINLIERASEEIKTRK